MTEPVLVLDDNVPQPVVIQNDLLRYLFSDDCPYDCFRGLYDLDESSDGDLHGTPCPLHGDGD